MPNEAYNGNGILRKLITPRTCFPQLHASYTLMVAIYILKFVGTNRIVGNGENTFFLNLYVIRCKVILVKWLII